MSEEYVYNCIVTILKNKPENAEPRNVRWTELVDDIIGDLQQVVNVLVADKRLTFKHDVNKQPMFYLTDNSAV